MVIQSVKMALKSILTNKMRSFLTMLGIIIGVIALVVLVSLTSSATSSVTDQIADLGSDTISAEVWDDKGRPLKLSDIEELMSDPEIHEAAAYVQTNMTVSHSYTSKSATVYGVTSLYGDINGLNLDSGRFIRRTDVDNHTNVCVINAGTAREVMGRMDVLGQTIRIGSLDYTIVGVLEADDSNSMTYESYSVYVPYSSLARASSEVSMNVTSFVVTASSDDSNDAAEAVVTDFMNERFDNDEDAYYILNMSSIMDAVNNVTGILSILLGGIAAISLLVGGIGIMNIMLVSVTERTREIGIRKAIGATTGSIMLQFLIESLVISLVGYVIGIAFSGLIIGIVSVVGSSTGISFHLSGSVVFLSLVFSVVIGVLFGIYPARKAAKKKPIDALRYTV